MKNNTIDSIKKNASMYNDTECAKEFFDGKGGGTSHRIARHQKEFDEIQEFIQRKFNTI